MEEIRLQKYIADCGITSRRKAEELIKQGKIKVNGNIVTELGTKINPQKDVVLYENRQIKQEKNYVMMCGDGINDSPALANSDIGVSVKSGTDIAMDSSDVILTKNDLNSILKLINISQKTVRNIKQNLFWAFFYNMLMIPIAIGVLKPIGISINPMFASLAMMFSSLTVILNALRLKKVCN